MAGGVFRNSKDKILDSIPMRDNYARNWGKAQAGFGILVSNAGKDYPTTGLGDPNIIAGEAYYKWDGEAFFRISEGEDVDANPTVIYLGASPTTLDFGYLQAGSNIFGMSLQEILERALVEYIHPAFSSFLIQGLVMRMEVGESIPAGPLTFTWTILPDTNVKSGNVTIRDVTSNTDLLSIDVSVGNATYALANPIPLLFPGLHTFRIEARNTRNEIFQRDVSVNAEYKIFFNAGLWFNSALIRQADNRRFVSEGPTFILNTGTEAFIFFVWVPLTANLVSIVDLDDGNQDITLQYMLINNVPVNDAGGSPVNGKVYLMTPLGPYATNHRHQITVN